jgi:hypothetical protein
MVRDAERGAAESPASTGGFDGPVRIAPHGATRLIPGLRRRGPPPYHVYDVTPAIGFGFGTDETLTPTRWRF